jgi:hypothetical protein
VNQALAEWHVQRLQAKLRRDAERGATAAVDRDICRIDNYKFRIAVDEWLIRQNSLCDPGYYPFRVTDPISCAALADARRPAQIPDPWQPVLAPAPAPAPMAAPPVSITIVNAEPAGPGVAFAIDGVAYQAVGGSRQNLLVTPDSIITYDAGGSLGQRRYQISAGLYQFRSTPEGWALYKLPDMP